MDKRYKILLAEDEAKLAKAIQDELTRVGYEVDVADNGLQADKMFMENDYSMALLDINLPGKMGWLYVVILGKEVPIYPL